MKQITRWTAVLLMLALPIMAAAKTAQPDRVFATYEEARQALLKGSLTEVKGAAARLADAAHAAGQQKLMALAGSLGRTSDIKAARLAFSAISDEAIRYRATSRSDKPVVAYCSMEKKSWMQPSGEIGNPYLDGAMRKCGEIRER